MSRNPTGASPAPGTARPAVALILPAAGRSTRLPGETKKPFHCLHGRPILLHTLDAFRSFDEIIQRIVAVAEDDLAWTRERWGKELEAGGVTDLIAGGEERQDTVAAALDVVSPNAEWVAIHDAVRPCIAAETIAAVLAEAKRSGAAIVAVPVTDTLKEAEDHRIVRTVDRRNLWAAQTPQVFRPALLREACRQAQKKKVFSTDDSALVEALGHPVSLVAGSIQNLKITTPEDLIQAERYLEREA
jgi:2-C-methyl-D-erythritol 4-phosphate cytidylyltransferase